MYRKFVDNQNAIQYNNKQKVIKNRFYLQKIRNITGNGYSCSGINFIQTFFLSTLSTNDYYKEKNFYHCKMISQRRLGWQKKKRRKGSDKVVFFVKCWKKNSKCIHSPYTSLVIKIFTMDQCEIIWNQSLLILIVTYEKILKSFVHILFSCFVQLLKSWFLCYPPVVVRLYVHY